MTIRWTLIDSARRHWFVLACGHVILAPASPQNPACPDQASCPHCSVEQ